MLGPPNFAKIVLAILTAWVQRPGFQRHTLQELIFVASRSIRFRAIDKVHPTYPT